MAMESVLHDVSQRNGEICISYYCVEMPEFIFSYSFDAENSDKLINQLQKNDKARFGI